ncbi:MAG: hypothetical protein PF689_04825 [Deltaproteobacteria bacterium]|jgi:hypothetical protein|nr:hypothetical protein [Deltaproteobacteria bacterium]
MNFLFLILLSTNLPQLKCNQNFTLLKSNKLLILHKGKTTVADVARPYHLKSPVSCNYFRNKKLLYVKSEKFDWFFVNKNKKLKLIKAFAKVATLEQNNLEYFDAKNLELYRKFESLRTCQKQNPRLFRSRFSQGKFIKIKGNTLKLPASAKTVSASFKNDISFPASSLLPFKAKAASSWRGESDMGDFAVPEPVKMNDKNGDTAWIGGESAGKGTYFILKRKTTGYQAVALRFLPGHYSGKKSLNYFSRLKSFYLVDSNGKAFRVKLERDPASLKGGHRLPWQVKLPGGLKGSCIMLILESFYDGKDKQGNKTPPAISEFHLLSDLDFKKDPFAFFLQGYHKKEVDEEQMRSVLTIVSPEILKKYYLQKTLDPELKKLILEISAQRKVTEFIPEFIEALSWAEGNLKKYLVESLKVKSAQKPLLSKVLDKKANKSTRIKALQLYLQSGGNNFEAIQKYVSKGNWSDYTLRRMVAKYFNRASRSRVLEGLCKHKKTATSPGLLWIGTRWTRKDKKLKKQLSKCLQYVPGQDFVQRMRYLYAAEVAGDGRFLNIVHSIYHSDSREGVQIRALKTALALRDRNIAKEAFSSKNPVLKAAAIRSWPAPRLPEAMRSEVENRWVQVRQVVWEHFIDNCSPPLAGAAVKILDNRKNIFWSKVLGGIATCKLEKMKPRLSKLFRQGKKDEYGAQIAMVLAQLGGASSDHKYLRSLIAAKLEKFAKVGKGGHNQQKIDLSGYLTALEQFKREQDNDYFIQLAKKDLPREVFTTLIEILKKRCPKSLKGKLNTLSADKDYTSEKVKQLGYHCYGR